VKNKNVYQLVCKVVLWQQSAQIMAGTLQLCADKFLPAEGSDPSCFALLVSCCETEKKSMRIKTLGTETNISGRLTYSDCLDVVSQFPIRIASHHALVYTKMMRSNASGRFLPSCPCGSWVMTVARSSLFRSLWPEASKEFQKHVRKKGSPSLMISRFINYGQMPTCWRILRVEI
jgi:hypothetical protein